MQELAKQTRAWACYDCGKCTATCPISRAGARLSPRKHVLATVLGHEEVIASDVAALSSCLSCSLCEFRCPAQVGYTELVLKLREMVYSEQAEPECPHGGAMQSMMRMMAHGGTKQDRLGWLGDDLQTEASQGNVFYWTGCTMYYDAFFPELELSTLNGTRAAVKVLNALGITPVVSAEERCCGHDLLWNGDRKSFEALARHNTKLVADSGAKMLVTSCAECLRTWRQDYQPFLERPIQVLHISELLADRLDNEESPLAFSEQGQLRVTFQDPCRMGRHLGVYEAPRRVMGAVPGVELVEMFRSRERGTCCAGGTWSNCDRYSKQIQVERLREARGTGAEVMVTSCPKCQVHFRCAMKDPNLKEEIEIEMRDVAELVAEALG